MRSGHQQSRLNELINRLQYSLLQYLASCQPYLGPDDQPTWVGLGRLRDLQREHAQALRDYCQAQQWPLDHSHFPDEFASHHYVALQFLMPILVENQRQLVRQFELVRVEFPEDSTLGGLVRTTCDGETEILRELESFAGR